jgi:hypothetical protein
MTRGEAPGGSRPSLSAQSVRRMGGSLQPLLAGALTPIRTASPAARAQKPVGNRQRHSWGWLAVPQARRRKNPPLFFSPAQKRVSALGRAFSYIITPIWMGVIL